MGLTRKTGRVVGSSLRRLGPHLSRYALESPTSAAQPPGPDVLEQIRQLGRLRDEGYLTEAQFEEKREDLLGRL